MLIEELREILTSMGEISRGTKTELEARLKLAIARATELSHGGKSCAKKRSRSESVAVVCEMSELAKQLVCPCCYDVMAPPILQCESGHVICVQCRDKLKPRRCPECRCDLNRTIRNLALERAAEHLELPCGNRGCGAVLPYALFSQHQHACDHTPFQCPACDCSWTGTFAELDEHCLERHLCDVEGLQVVNIRCDCAITNVSEDGALDVSHWSYVRFFVFDAAMFTCVVFADHNPKRGLLSIGAIFVGPLKDTDKYQFEICIGKATHSGALLGCQQLQSGVFIFHHTLLHIPDALLKDHVDAEGTLNYSFRIKLDAQKTSR